MTIARPPDGRVRPIPEQWAVDACVRITGLRNLKDVALAGAQPAGEAARRAAVARAIESFLDTAVDAFDRRAKWMGRRGPIDRWRGTSVVVAYQSLHAAEVFLVDLLPDEQIQVLVPSVVARATAALMPGDPRRAAIEQLPQQVAELRPGYRTAVQQAMRIGYDASDRTHVRVRNFRNMLFASAALLMVLLGALVLLVARSPEAMPLCFTPGNTSVTTTTSAAQAQTVCPSGDGKHPSGGDVVIVAGLGLLGGALAAAFSIRNVRGTSTPYDVPIALALLKPPLGALTAISSILLLGGNFVPGLSELDSQRQILAYALVFGYAQQLISRLIDNQADSIMKSLPGKDGGDSRQVTPVTAAPVAPSPSPEPGLVARIRQAIRPSRKR
ncbi:MAG TPA: hypothetical protein VH502_09045 [Actinoplanes sp.]